MLQVGSIWDHDHSGIQETDRFEIGINETDQVTLLARRFER